VQQKTVFEAKHLILSRQLNEAKAFASNRTQQQSGLDLVNYDIMSFELGSFQSVFSEATRFTKCVSEILSVTNDP